MDLPAWMTPDEVQVEAYDGAGVAGPVFAAPVTSRARYEDGSRLYRDAAGARRHATATVWLPLDAADDLPVESRITRNGRTYVVVAATRHEFGGPTPNHWEVALR